MDWVKKPFRLRVAKSGTWLASTKPLPTVVRLREWEPIRHSIWRRGNSPGRSVRGQVELTKPALPSEANPRSNIEVLPHEFATARTTGGGRLCLSLLRLVQDNRKIEQLREEISGFSHRCRNLLNGMKMSLYLVRRGADSPLPALWANVEQSYGRIEQLLDRLQMIYRPMTLALVRRRLDPWSTIMSRTGATTSGLAADRSRSCHRPRSRRGAFDPMLLSGGFDAFLRWRAAMVRTGQRARLSWKTSNARLEVSWNEAATDPASTSRERHTQAPTADLSLALPLLARVFTAHHGAIQLTPAPEFKVLFTCPLEQPEPVL